MENVYDTAIHRNFTEVAKDDNDFYKSEVHIDYATITGDDENIFSDLDRIQSVSLWIIPLDGSHWWITQNERNWNELAFFIKRF